MLDYMERKQKSLREPSARTGEGWYLFILFNKFKDLQGLESSCADTPWTNPATCLLFIDAYGIIKIVPAVEGRIVLYGPTQGHHFLCRTECPMRKNTILMRQPFLCVKYTGNVPDRHR
jgi:hypothetical protein